MNKAILCIGGSELQLPTLTWAKQAGLRVLLTDASPEPPGRQLADVFAQISGDDVEALVGYAQEQSTSSRIVSAYCGSDFGLQSVALVNQALGLAGLNPTAVKTSLHKANANRVLRNAGIPVPDGRILKANENPPTEALRYPLIVKPVDGSGSRGVTRVENADQLEFALQTARAVNSEILIEQLVEGEHLDVNGFFVAGRFFPGGQLARYFSPPPHCYPVWGYQPPDMQPDEQKGIYRVLEEAARALGLDWGPVKADIILGPEGPTIIEVTPRFHGDVSTSFVCPLAHGVSPVQLWMKWLADAELPPTTLFSQSDQKAGWAGIFPTEVGTIQAIQGVESVRSMPGIASILLRRSTGWKVERLDDNRAVIGFLFATGADAFELRDRLTSGLSQIHVHVSKESTA